MITSTTIWLNMGNIRSRIVHYYLHQQAKKYETGDTINNMSLSFNKKLFKNEVPSDRERDEHQGTTKLIDVINTQFSINDLYSIGDEYSPQLTQSNDLQRQKIIFLLDGIK